MLDNGTLQKLLFWVCVCVCVCVHGYCLIGDNDRLQYLRFCSFEMYVNVVFAIRCSYSAVTLTLVTEQRLIIMIYYYYGCISDPLFLCRAEGSRSAVDPDLALHVFHHVVVLLTQHLQHTTPPSAGLRRTKTKHQL